MARRIVATLLVCLCAWVGGSPVRGQEGQPLSMRILDAWKEMRRHDPGSAEFTRAEDRLRRHIGQLDAAEKPLAAAVLMDRHAPDHVNAAALAYFGPDFLDSVTVKRILADEDRTFSQRVLLRTYYHSGPVSDMLRPRLTALLAERIEGLAGKEAPYGEQRLLVHLTSATLTHTNGADDTPERKRLLQAMEACAAQGKPEEPFAANCAGWLEVREGCGEEPSSVENALKCLGHWDALKRWKAGRRLARRIEGQYVEARHATGEPSVFERVWEKLSDPRDNVRMAAVEVFGQAALNQAAAEKVTPGLVGILLYDRGVVVQEAAAKALAAHSRHAAWAAEPLLKVLATPRPGPRRTGSILTALGYLVPHADEARQEKMLAAAMDKMLVAPRGALTLMKALGPTAQVAVGMIRAYRKGADQLDRVYIDRHVLPAILPNGDNGEELGM